MNSSAQCPGENVGTPGLFQGPTSDMLTSVCQVPLYGIGEYTLDSAKSMGDYHQYSRLKSSMPFKHDVALQNILLSKKPLKMQPQS